MLPPQEVFHCGYLVVTWRTSLLSITGFPLSFVIYGLYICEHFKVYYGEIKAIFLGDFNAQPVMKPWADHDIEWGHSNSGHFVVNESTDDGEFNQNVGRCSMILPTNLLKEEKKCFVQPERRITALHWISRWLDNI